MPNQVAILAKQRGNPMRTGVLILVKMGMRRYTGFCVLLPFGLRAIEFSIKTY